MEFARPSPKLLLVGLFFSASSLLFGITLGRSLSSLALTGEALLSAIPVLFFLFLTVSLVIVYALLTAKEPLALGVAGAAIAAILLVLPLSFPSFYWKLAAGLLLFFGFFFLNSQAQGVHEAYTGFSASHFKGVMRNFFLLFVFILALILFTSASQALGRGKFEIPEETLRPIVAQFVEMVGGMLQQQVGRKVPEAQLAPYVEEQLVQLLRQIGLKVELKGKPGSFAQVTDRLSKALGTELEKVLTPFKTYIPFVVAGIAVLTLFSFSPFVGLIGTPIFFLVYRFLILVRVLKFEEVERTVKRLALA